MLVGGYKMAQPARFPRSADGQITPVSATKRNDFEPMDGRGRYIFQPPQCQAVNPSRWSTLPPPFTDEAESGRVADQPQFREMIEEGSQPNSPFREILIRQTQ